MSSMKDRLTKQAQKAQAEHPPVPPPQSQSASPARREGSARDAGVRWEDSHRRATFHLPNDLLARLDERAGASGESKSSMVARALDAWLTSTT